MGDRVQREGNVVRRPLESWSPAVHSLLRHLEAVEFPSPRVIGVDGEDEVLTWIDGESGAEGWAKIVPESGLRRWAMFLRRYHDAVRAYRPDPVSVWSSGTGGCGPGEVVCHCDFGPWNGVWRGNDIVGLIDFDQAAPACPFFDVAYALQYAAPFRDDEESMRWLRYSEPPDRRHRIQVFCDAYGVGVPDDVGARVADVQRAIMQRCEALGRQGVEPQATWIRDGYLETVRARISWTEALQL